MYLACTSRSQSIIEIKAAATSAGTASRSMTTTAHWLALRLAQLALFFFSFLFLTLKTLFKKKNAFTTVLKFEKALFKITIPKS